MISLAHQSEKGRYRSMLNKIMLIGNLGKDPELQITSEGTPFTRFSLAVNRSYTSSSGEKVEETEWFNIVVWRQLAEICERYLHKGSKVYLEGGSHNGSIPTERVSGARVSR